MHASLLKQCKFRFLQNVSVYQHFITGFLLLLLLLIIIFFLHGTFWKQKVICQKNLFLFYPLQTWIIATLLHLMVLLFKMKSIHPWSPWIPCSQIFSIEISYELFLMVFKVVTIFDLLSLNSWVIQLWQILLNRKI